MKIVITSDAVADKPLIDGFAVATNWNDRIGQTKEEWLQGQVVRFIVEKATLGFVQSSTVAERSALITANRAAVVAAGKVIIAPTTSVKSQ